MRLLSGLLTLSSSVPGAIGPSFAEDVYGLNQFEHSKVPSNRSISDAIGPSSSIHLFSKSPGVERCKFRNFQEWMIVELEDWWKNMKEHFFLAGNHVSSLARRYQRLDMVKVTKPCFTFKRETYKDTSHFTKKKKQLHHITGGLSQLLAKHPKNPKNKKMRCFGRFCVLSLDIVMHR